MWKDVKKLSQRYNLLEKSPRRQIYFSKAQENKRDA